MKWPLIFLASLSLAAACVVEDTPVGAGGTTGTGATGGDPTDECGGCSGERPVCDTTDFTCVECLPGMEGACDATAPVCDPDEKICVCNDDEECTDPALSRCNTTARECEACATNDDCEGIEGSRGPLTICDDDTCVECTVETETDLCGAVACNPMTKECTGAEIGSLNVCDECVADSECGNESQQPSEAFRCVPMFYPNEGERFPGESIGFCLKTTEGGCERPYAVTLEDRPSLSEPTASNDYCGINESLATCSAVAALVADERCPSGLDDDCPESGICRQVGALQNRCTYRCGLAAQCPADPPADTCGPGPGETENYCGG
jgi:hypothetical protein